MAEKKKATAKAAATKADKPAEKKASKTAPKVEAKKAAPKKEVKAKEEEKKASKAAPKEETKKAAATSKDNSKKVAPKDDAKKASVKKPVKPKNDPTDETKAAKGDSKKSNSKVVEKPTGKGNVKKNAGGKDSADADSVVVEPVETPADATKNIKGGKKPAQASKPEPEPATPAVETVTVVEIDEAQYFPVLLRGVKKLRSVFFTEVNEQEERANKKKVSSDVKAAEKPTIALRHKASLAEETPEELHARVIRELEEANRIFEAEIANQVCTRCCINPVVAEFRVDKDLGYCEECAAILKLGQSKEARQTEYNMNFGRDDDDEDEDEDFEDGPTAEDLEEAEEDLED